MLGWKLSQVAFYRQFTLRNTTRLSFHPNNNATHDGMSLVATTTRRVTTVSSPVPTHLQRVLHETLTNGTCYCNATVNSPA